MTCGPRIVRKRADMKRPILLHRARSAQSTTGPAALVLALSILANSPAQAADAEAQGREIVVTGRGLDASPATPAYDVQVLEREQILSSGSGRIEDVLGNVAGFQQFRRSDSRSSNPSAQGATLRALGGNATSRSLVLLDGVPMADPFFGYVPFSAIAPDRLSSVRVTRGGGSGGFGAGAVAGTIELDSANAGELGLLSGGALINDRGESEASASIAPQLGAGFAVLTGRWDRGRGFYTTPADQRAPASARAKYDSWSLGARLVQPLSDEIELQARALFFDDQRTLRFRGADSTSSGQDASIRLVGRGNWAFDLLAYAQWRDFSNIVISSTRFVPVLDQHDTPSTGIGGKAELRPPVGDDHVLRLGADFRRARGHMEETAISAFSGNVTAERRAGGTNDDLGLFLEDDWTIGPLILTGGVRLDRYAIRRGHYREQNGAGVPVADDRFASRSDWKPTFRGGLVADVAQGLRLRAAAYSGLRLPTLNELYRGFVVFPVTTQANEELGIEKLRGFEGGIYFTPREGVQLSLTAFDNRLKGAIANVTIAENLRQRRNVDAIRARGVELASAIDLGSFRFDGSLAYTHARVKGSGAATALDGMRPAQTPAWAASGTLSWRPRDGWLLATTLRHVGAQYEDDLETDVLPAATTLDAFAQIGLMPGLSLVLRGENLFDEKIVTRNQGGSMDLGTPLTVWGGVRFGY